MDVDVCIFIVNTDGMFGQKFCGCTEEISLKSGYSQSLGQILVTDKSNTAADAIVHLGTVKQLDFGK